MKNTHLQEKAKELLDKPIEDKIIYIQEDKWIGYTRAKHILDRLEDLMCYPKTKRMPNLLIVGDSNNGKTQILNHFSERYPMGIDENTYINTQPVIYVNAPSRPDENALFIRLLNQMYVPFAKNDSISVKREIAVRTMKDRKTKMIIIDEIHQIITGSYNAQRNILNGIKDLSNELQIPIVAAGTEEAFNAIGVDPQLENRFKVEVLERWPFNNREEKREFSKLIVSIESRLPLPEPSFLYKPPLLQILYDLSEGLIGEVIDIIKQLAIYAVKNKEPRIQESFFKKLDLQPASMRHQLLKRKLR